jgi:hypothetical protein
MPVAHLMVRNSASVDLHPPAITMTTDLRKAYPRTQVLGVEEVETIGSVVAVSTTIGEAMLIVEEEVEVVVVGVGISVVVDVGGEEVVADIGVSMILIARRMGEGRVIGIMITLLVVEGQDSGILTIECNFEYQTFVHMYDAVVKMK